MSELTPQRNFETIEFLPDWYLKQRTRSRRNHRQAGLVMIMIAGLSMVVFQTESRRDDLALYHQTLEDQLGSTKKQITEVSKLQADKAEMDKKVQIFRQLHQPLTYWQVVATLASLIPKPVVLEEVDVKTEEVRTTRTIEAPPPPSRPVSGVVKKPRTVTEISHTLKIELTGHSPTDVIVAEFIGKLAGSGLFQNVKIIYARQGRIEGLAAREFMVRMYVPLDRQYIPKTRQETADAR